MIVTRGMGPGNTLITRGMGFFEELAEVLVADLHFIREATLTSFARMGMDLSFIVERNRSFERPGRPVQSFSMPTRTLSFLKAQIKRFFEYILEED